MDISVTPLVWSLGTYALGLVFHLVLDSIGIERFAELLRCRGTFGCYGGSGNMSVRIVFVCKRQKTPAHWPKQYGFMSYDNQFFDTDFWCCFRDATM